MIEQLARIQEHCQSAKIYLSISRAEQPIEFAITVVWYRTGNKVSYERHFSLFQFNHTIDSERELMNFAEDAKHAINRYDLNPLSLAEGGMINLK